MTQTTPPPIPTLIPDSAPFSAEQRTWLNGFFAGLLSLDGGVNALSSEETAALMNDVMGTGAATARGPLDDGDDGQTPWHDPAMPLGERMQLAESRPLRRRFMAAMGQQDCGQCGYNCEDYANAIVLKNEERLNLCVPGGKDTTRMLKTLYAEFGAIPATAKAPATVPTPAADAAPSPTPTRDNPAEATFVSRTRLNKPGSQKETWHIDIDLAQSGIDYAVGDSFGMFPHNEPALVYAVLAALGAPPDFPIAGRPLRDVLTDGVSLGVAPDMLFQLISYITGGERRQKAKALGSGGDPDGDAADARRAGGAGKISRHPARSRSVHRSARSAAAAALFDRVVAEGRARQSGAHHRHRSLQDRQARAGAASPRPISPTASRPAPRSRPISRRRSISACPPTRRSRSS